MFRLYLFWHHYVSYQHLGKAFFGNHRLFTVSDLYNINVPMIALVPNSGNPKPGFRVPAVPQRNGFKRQVQQGFYFIFLSKIFRALEYGNWEFIRGKFASVLKKKLVHCERKDRNTHSVLYWKKNHLSIPYVPILVLEELSKILIHEVKMSGVCVFPIMP